MLSSLAMLSDALHELGIESDIFEPVKQLTSSVLVKLYE
jgi:hypothetical protein